MAYFSLLLMSIKYRNYNKELKAFENKYSKIISVTSLSRNSMKKPIFLKIEFSNKFLFF